MPEAEPPACTNVAVVPNDVPSLDTSKPAGAVAVISPVRLVPDTVIVVVPDASPYVVETPASVPDAMMAGSSGTRERMPKFTPVTSCPAATTTVWAAGGAT